MAATAPHPTTDDATRTRRRDPVARDFDPADERAGAPLLEALMAPPPQPARAGLPPPAQRVFRGAAALVLVAAALAIGGAQLGAPAAWVRLLDNLHWTVADVAAAWLCWIGVRSARVGGQRAEFAARRWCAVGFSAYAIGQLTWDLQAALGWHPFPAPSDPFFMMMAPACAVAMMGYLRGRVSPTQRLSALLDTLTLAIAVVAMALAAYLPRHGDIDLLPLSVMVAYPTLLLAGACVGLMLIALLRVAGGWSVWTLTAMLAAHGGLWMEWNVLSLQGLPTDGRLVNAAFSACTLAGGLAVSCWRVRSTANPRVDRLYDGALRVLPLVVVVGVTFAVTLQDSIAQLSASARAAFDAAAVVVIVLAAIRQTLQLRDRDQLFEAQRQLREREQELHELNQHLELRVQQRTSEVELRNCELSTALQQLSMAQGELVRAEKLAGLGSLVGGVTTEIARTLSSANMVATMLPGQLESLRRHPAVNAAAAGDGAERRRSTVAGHLSALDASHRQMAQALEEAQRVIAGFQRIAFDQTSEQRRVFDLLATVRELVDLIRLAHRHDPVEIVVTGEPGLELDSFPGPIGQVLDQLIDNAIVHGFARSGEGSIAVRVWPSGHESVRITVHDNGGGIAPEHLPRVFAPFFTTRMAEGGTGLGLTISRNIVDGLLGGRIELVSPAAGGTTVTLTLPRRAPLG